MKKLLLLGATFLLCATFFVQPAGAYLSDLFGHWSTSMVLALEAWGLVSGDESGRFLPDTPMSRAQLAKFLTVGLGYEKTAKELRQQPSRYADVPAWHWARGFIEALAEIGITEGYPGGRFGPNDSVTRAQLAVVAVRTLGLADQARLSSTESTRYDDDADIPSWARGAINVALNQGIMTGLPDGEFRPNREVTRAEGVATVYRILARRGALYHLSGTLVHYDPNQGTGVVRNALGEETSFTMAVTARYARQGEAANPKQIRVLDQVFLVLDDNGSGVFLEARYQDFLAQFVEPNNDGLTITLATGERLSRGIQEGALVLVNGRPGTIEEVQGATPVYLVFDQATGEIRLIDAVRFNWDGIFGGLTSPGGEIILMVDGDTLRFPLSSDLILIADGEKVGLDYLTPGDEVSLALDATGRVTYMEVTR